MTADATDRASIGAEKEIVTGSATARSVATVVWNSPWVNGRITVGGVATVTVGRVAPTTPAPSTMARPMARLALARVERRSSAPR